MFLVHDKIYKKQTWCENVRTAMQAATCSYTGVIEVLKETE